MSVPTTVRRDPHYLGPAQEVDVKDLPQYEKKGGWVIEPKLDGMFASLTVRNPAEKRLHVLKSRDARTPAITGANAGSILDLNLGRMPEGTVIVGELEAATQWATQVVRKQGFRRLHVFDIVQFGDKNMRHIPLCDRRRFLQAMMDGTIPEGSHERKILRLVPFQAKNFAAWYSTWLNDGYEGVVLKKSASLYKTRGTDGKTLEWARLKRMYTHDYVLCGLAVTPGKQITGEWGLNINGKVTKVLQAFAPPELLVPENVGKIVAEFEGYAVFTSGSLRHAQYVRTRADKAPAECLPPVVDGGKEEA